MFKTMLIAAGVLIGLGARALPDLVPIGIEVRSAEGRLIGRIVSIKRDDEGRLMSVTIEGAAGDRVFARQ